LALRLERLPFALSLAAALADWRAMRWLKRHRGRTFADFYVALNEKRIRAGKPHPTLGKAGYCSDKKLAMTWTPDTFRNRAHDHWSVYRDQGLQPWMRTLDYGCGSLRLGQHAIAYLDPDRYCGIDPSPHFIEEGLSLLDPEIVAAKRPWVDRLDDQTVDRIRQWEPQFIFSHAVVQHVPRAELPTYFERLGRMMASGCSAVIMFVSAKVERRIKAMSWAYSEVQLEQIARQAMPDASIRFTGLPKGREGLSGGGRRLMVISRPDPDRGD
jgi:hypothetical protein